MIVSFTSHTNPDSPRYDWKLMKSLDTDILFLRDDKQGWYLRGLTDISTDVESTKIFVLDYVSKYSKVLFVGSSMGGYGSLLYGSLVDHPNKTIMAFNPQVTISGSDTLINGWVAWKVKDNVLPFISNDDRKYLKLHKSITPPKETYIHYPKWGYDDVYQVNLLRSRCKLIGHDTKDHSTAQYLNRNDKLLDTITETWLM